MSSMNNMSQPQARYVGNENDITSLFNDYKPGNLAEMREKLRSRIQQTMKQEQDLSNMKKSLQCLTPRSKSKTDTKITNQTKPLSSSSKINQSQPQQNTKASSCSYAGGSEYQKKMQILHQREQERLQAARQSNRRQTIARSPKLARHNDAESYKTPKRQQKHFIDQQDITFVPNPDGLKAIKTNQYPDSRYSMMGSITHRPSMAPSSFDSTPRRSVYSNPMSAVPLTSLYTQEQVNRRLTMFGMQPNYQARSLLTPSKSNLLTSPKRRAEFVNAASTSHHVAPPRENVTCDVVAPVQKDSLANALHSHLNNQTPEVQQQIQKLLNTLESGNLERKSLYISSVPKKEDEVKKVVDDTPHDLPISRKSEGEPLYVPSDCVKRILQSSVQSVV
ncbi:m7GpppX diphosphatase [Acrasis kona]|uniref:M7GpppX diphosphatase n=1 Tax=Acrasis kona TaxID=1008807 RepID=A0AAW2ZGQ7_9EUKA